MKKVLIALVSLGLIFLLSIIGIGLTGDKSIPKTVIHDKLLPQIEIDGVRLHAETFGDSFNPMVVVIHGGPGQDYRYLLPLKKLQDDYFVVFYDQRGAGLSERVSEEKLNLDAYREELHKIIQFYKKDKPVYLIGHSWGAMLATYYLSKYGKGISKAVLAEPGFLTKKFFTEFFKRTNGFQPKKLSFSMGLNVLKAIIRGQFISEPDSDAGMDYTIAGIMNSSPTGSPVAGYFCNQDTRTGSLDMWRMGGKSMNMVSKLVETHMKNPEEVSFDLTKGLEDYTAPVLFLAGSCNRIIGEDIQEQQMKLFNNAKLKVIPGAGHTMFGEKPARSLMVVREFLAHSE